MIYWWRDPFVTNIFLQAQRSFCNNNDPLQHPRSSCFLLPLLESLFSSHLGQPCARGPPRRRAAPQTVQHGGCLIWTCHCRAVCRNLAHVIGQRGNACMSLRYSMPTLAWSRGMRLRGNGHCLPAEHRNLENFNQWEGKWRMGVFSYSAGTPQKGVFLFFFLLLRFGSGQMKGGGMRGKERRATNWTNVGVDDDGRMMKEDWWWWWW